jgi:Tol biopolymer transport system component
MNEDGSDIKLLAKAERVTGHRWSPDGSQLAFVTGKAIPVGLDRDIYVLDLH